MNMMECMEAYGFDKGKLKCKALIEDFQECTGQHKQRLRIEVSEWNNEYNDSCEWTKFKHIYFVLQAMKRERQRQYDVGLLKEQYEPPPHMNAY